MESPAGLCGLPTKVLGNDPVAIPGNDRRSCEAMKADMKQRM